MVNALRHRNRVFRKDRGTADHLRHVGPPVQEQQADVRPGDGKPLELLLGEPVIGPLADSGIRLDLFPVVLTTWEEWLDEHPDTTVLSIYTGIYDSQVYRHEADPRSPYYEYRNTRGTMFAVPFRDDRFGVKEEVLGVSSGGSHKAYPVWLLRKEAGSERRGGRRACRDRRLTGVIGGEGLRSRRAVFRAGRGTGRSAPSTRGLDRVRLASRRRRSCEHRRSHRCASPGYRPASHTGSAGSPSIRTRRCTRVDELLSSC